MATWNRNVSMRALRAFCAASRRGSFRLAAEDLYLTASAVSHQIKQLEEQLGVQLFRRRPRALQITEAGQALADDLEPVLEDLDTIIERNSVRVTSAALRLSVLPFFSSELLVPRLSEFLASNPELSVNVETIDDDSGALDRTADISIQLFTSPPRSLPCDRLFPMRLLPVGSPQLYDEIKVVSGRVVSNLTLIVHNSRPRAWREWQKSSGITMPRDARTMRFDSMIAVARAAEEGIGAALMPAQMCGSWIKAGTLTPLFDHELESQEAYYVVGHSAGQDNRNVEVLRHWLLREFAEVR